MSEIETLSCGHPIQSLAPPEDTAKWHALCYWCQGLSAVNAEKRELFGEVHRAKKALAASEERIEDLERDNKALKEQLGKQALTLQPGRHDFGDVELGYVVMLPGASIGGPHEPLTITSDPPNADTLAKSEREPCPECGKPSEIASIPCSPENPLMIRLSCGCETLDRAWLRRAHARERQFNKQQEPTE